MTVYVSGRFRAGWCVLALMVALVSSGCYATRVQEAWLVLTDIAAGDAPSRLKRLTQPPRVENLTLEIEGKGYRADLYRPAEPARCGLLVIPGAAEGGKDDPRLVAFATTLARARFMVLVPDFPSLRALQVTRENVGEVARVLSWQLARADLVPNGRLGVVAFSYGAGPAILAALRPALQERIDFILAVGPYHDLERVLTFFTTGYFRHQGQWHYLEPNRYGKWVFVLSNLERLGDAGDRQRFRAMAKRKFADSTAPLDDLADGLTREGKRLLQFLLNRDPQQVPELLAGLPENIRNEMAALDLARRDLSALEARLLLVHGRSDAIIPFTESLALAEAAGSAQARVFLADGLAHVDVDPGLKGLFSLWRAVHALLRERDGLAGDPGE